MSRNKILFVLEIYLRTSQETNIVKMTAKDLYT